MLMKNVVFSAIALLSFLTLLPTAADAQRRDYLTDQEIELVRDAQSIDDRVGVLVRAMDRRFDVLKINIGRTAKEQKESAEWGPLPTGARLDLLTDNKRIMQKAIDDIDNLAARPDSMVAPDPDAKKPKGYAEVFPKAVRVLASAAARYRPVLNNELSNATDGKEKGVLMDLIESCDEIAEAVTKLPAEIKKAKN